jgi:tetraspanin-13/31
VASLAKAGSYVSSLNIIAGIITTGSFFLFVSLLGLWGAIRESQATLFVYILLLGIVFILQFSISIAALAVDHHTTAADGWCALDDVDRISIQNKIGCYGFQSNRADLFNSTLPDYCMRPGLRCPTTCNVLPDCPGTGIKETCPLCYDALRDQIETMLNRAGGVGLGLAFTMVRVASLLGVLTYRHTHAHTHTHTLSLSLSLSRSHSRSRPYSRSFNSLWPFEALCTFPTHRSTPHTPASHSLQRSLSAWW